MNLSKVYLIRDKRSVIAVPLTQQSTSQPVICPHCQHVIASGRLDRHIQRAHSLEGLKRREDKAAKAVERLNAKKVIVACDMCDDKMQRRYLKKHKRTAHQFGLSLILISRRGSRIEGTRICDGCKKSSSETWRYTESSRGAVHLCLKCKQRYGDKSFVKKTDALDYCKFGGGFESNRRRF
nr:hypothetical protein [uncultured Noviherbaspirillum sp.]